MNTPVEYKLAKLLKEKGFDKFGACYILNGDYYTSSNLLNPSITGKEKPEYISAPTIAEVRMWLYEKHCIWIEARITFFIQETGIKERGFQAYINDVPLTGDIGGFINLPSPTEAYTAAIEYTLKELL